MLTLVQQITDDEGPQIMALPLADKAPSLGKRFFDCDQYRAGIGRYGMSSLLFVQFLFLVFAVVTEHYNNNYIGVYNINNGR